MGNTRYPIGIQTFSNIIEGQYIYIDKTKYVYKLAKDYKYIFLSRPRRFGKSLLTSTFESYFEGKKDLFKGLEIDNLEKEYSEDITDLDLTGGYLIGMHMQDDGHGVLVKTKSGKTFNVFSPRDDEKEYKRANEYISDYLQRVENAIYGISEDGSEPENIWDLMDKENN